MFLRRLWGVVFEVEIGGIFAMDYELFSMLQRG
jgi:hypothetical protein